MYHLPIPFSELDIVSEGTSEEIEDEISFLLPESFFSEQYQTSYDMKFALYIKDKYGNINI